MKKFINKTSFFIIPFIVLYFTSLVFYSDTESPDLLRLGYIPNIYKDYRAIFSYTKNDEFDKLSKHKKTKYKILTIGDSFSEQAVLGYNNLLADNLSVLHVDRFISKNQIQTLINLANGDFFEKYDIEFVILQNVERDFIDNIKNINFYNKLMLHEIDSLILNHDVKKINYSYNLFSRTTIKFPLYDFPIYFFQKNYLANGNVYNTELNTPTLFSNNSSKLLFYRQDLKSTKKNNVKENIDSLNEVLNTIALKLSQRDIKLIVLPSPDKYDLYYNYIITKKSFTKPLFFDLMRVQKKDYLYIDSKAVLLSQIKNKPDLYFYDDTHWTPVASKIIADKIKDIISQTE